MAVRRLSIRVGYLALCLTCLLAAQSRAQESADAVPADQTFVNRFWQADSEVSRLALSEELLLSQPDPAALFELLKAGPVYSDEVPLGEHVLARTNNAGTEFPYMINIPQDYDPQRQWPVEFVLHGGVGRPKPAAGENFWQRSYNRIGQPGRITVVPLAWSGAVWWQDEQADSLLAILNSLKSTYNIDENRVSLTGISDGGTGAYFFAFKQPTQWASFLPYIGHPGVLRNPQSGGGYRLYFENLMNKPLYIVNGENDRLYPAASLSSFMDILKDVGVPHTWTVIAEGGHNTEWLPDYLDEVEQFKTSNPRDPFPSVIQWVADRTDRYNRNHWIQIDGINGDDRPALLQVDRSNNLISVEARGIEQFRLLLSPDFI
ncbi:MAG: dienelactone hydrolase family protein, partial [Pseudohongiellaceae bacterium]